MKIIRNVFSLPTIGSMAPVLMEAQVGQWNFRNAFSGAGALDPIAAAFKSGIYILSAAHGTHLRVTKIAIQ